MVDARLLASTVRPYQQRNPTPLESIALSKQDQRLDRQLNQDDRNLSLDERQQTSNEEKQRAAQEQRAKEIFLEAKNQSSNADEMIAILGSGGVPPDAEAIEKIRAFPPEFFTGGNKGPTAQQRQAKLDLEARNQELREQELSLKRDAETRQKSKLTAFSEKELGKATDSAIESGQSQQQLLTLADEFEDRGDEIVAGSAGDAREAIKAVLGTEDAISTLRIRYSAIRNSQAVKNLPPGVASDKDIELALSGFLKPSSNPTEIASFLRGMAKMEEFNVSFNEFKARYIDENNGVRGLLSAWKESEEAEALKEAIEVQTPPQTIDRASLEAEARRRGLIR